MYRKQEELTFLSSVQTAIIRSVSFTLQLATRKIEKARDKECVWYEPFNTKCA